MSGRQNTSSGIWSDMFEDLKNGTTTSFESCRSEVIASANPIGGGDGYQVIQTAKAVELARVRATQLEAAFEAVATARSQGGSVLDAMITLQEATIKFSVAAQQALHLREVGSSSGTSGSRPVECGYDG